MRDVLGEGLRLWAEIGVNPYRYGIVASTDTHFATPGAVSEDGYAGHFGPGAPPGSGLPDVPAYNPGGLAVLWAEENSREALFRAMKRREAYGTSGPRIVLRFFGGRGYDEGMCAAGDLAARGYGGGVPMGGDLPAGEGPPTFAIAATSDAGTAAHPGLPLQRLQIVKGWLQGDEVRVAVHDLATAAPGAGVDPTTCEPTGEGATELCAVWTDEDFDPDAPAFYYARAVEVPRCRWTTIQCNAAGIACPTDSDAWAGCCDERIAPTVQDRAWSSPIFHAP